MTSEYAVLPEGFQEANERGDYVENIIYNARKSVQLHAPKLILCGEIFNTQFQEMAETIQFLMGEVERLNEKLNELEGKK